MKKFKIYIMIIIIVILILSILGILFLNYLLSDKNIIDGYYKFEEYFDPFGTQDSIDYCKYYYTNEDDQKFANIYNKISEKDIDEIKECFNKFKEYMDASNRLAEYDFDENIIDNNDLYILYDKSNYRNRI